MRAFAHLLFALARIIRAIGVLQKRRERSAFTRNNHNTELAYEYYTRGRAKQGKGDVDGAIADHSLAIALNSIHVGAYIGHGVAKEAKGDLLPLARTSALAILFALRER